MAGKRPAGYVCGHRSSCAHLSPPSTVSPSGLGGEMRKPVGARSDTTSLWTARPVMPYRRPGPVVPRISGTGCRTAVPGSAPVPAGPRSAVFRPRPWCTPMDLRPVRRWRLSPVRDLPVRLRHIPRPASTRWIRCRPPPRVRHPRTNTTNSAPPTARTTYDTPRTGGSSGRPACIPQCFRSCLDTGQNVDIASSSLGVRILVDSFQHLPVPPGPRRSNSPIHTYFRHSAGCRYRHFPTARPGRTACCRCRRCGVRLGHVTFGTHAGRG